ncbi:MAG TPA: hypothetical protein VMI54_06840 [Polyangiaceae bacterium]|nr:hypothetical protein [Polyangiaceae bacterium]
MHTSPLLFGLFLLGLGSVACGAKSNDDRAPASGGQGGQGGSAGMTAAGGLGAAAGMGGMAITCPDPSDPIDPTAMIDDFENGSGLLPLVDKRNGSWWTAADDTGGTLVPEQSAITNMPAAPEMLPQPRCGSHYAMRITGEGFTDWGADLGVALAAGTRPNGEEGAVPYDASARTGVDFWARIGDTSTNSVFFEVSDSNSEPDGGICMVGGGTGKECYDGFGVNLTSLDTTWHHYRIPFSGLSQRNFGVKADGVVTNAIYNITFNFLSATDPFDFWLDDISFY